MNIYIHIIIYIHIQYLIDIGYLFDLVVKLKCTNMNINNYVYLCVILYKYYYN